MNSRPTEAGKHRIAFVHSALPAGGSTIFLLNLAGELVQRGVSVQVFSLTEKHPLVSDFVRRKIPVTLGETKGFIFEDRIQNALKSIAIFSPTVVVGNIDFEAGEVLRHLPAGVVRIGAIHAIHQIEFARVYVNALDSLVSVSTYVRDLIAQKPEFQNVPINCAELGVAIPDHVHRDDLNSGRPLRILYLGRLEDAAKRVRLFPTIFKQLKAKQIPFIWTIAGEGPERKFLESQLMTANPNQQIRFAGLVSYTDVPALLAENDIVLLTSDSEVFPLSLQEGMAAGLVPVASDLPGRVRDIVAPDAGILVEPSNVAGYAEGIDWLDHHRDKMRSMSVKAREIIGAEYSVPAMADRWLALLTAKEPRSIGWPKEWIISPPLFGAKNWRFSKPIRSLRRFTARMQKSLDIRN